MFIKSALSLCVTFMRYFFNISLILRRRIIPIKLTGGLFNILSSSLVISLGLLNYLLSPTTFEPDPCCFTPSLKSMPTMGLMLYLAHSRINSKQADVLLYPLIQMILFLCFSLRLIIALLKVFRI